MEFLEACFTSGGSSPQRLRLPEPKQREPMRMRLTRHQLLGTLARPIRNPAAKKCAVVQKELQQTQVLTAELATQREIVAQPGIEVLHH